MGDTAPRLHRCAGAAGAALLLGLGVLVAAQPAGAHIILVSDGGPESPGDWQRADSIGDPQKPTPCGGPGTPTNVVTTLRAGQTVTLTWTEAIAHGGHFRIAFAPVSPAAATPADLPDPVVTTYTNAAKSEASAVAITPAFGSISPVGVVLADNLYPHCIQGDPCPPGVPVTAAPKTYSATVTLPTAPCASCTLQVVQFMSYHPVDPSFFYHHCAAVTLLAASQGGESSGTTAATDAAAETVRPNGSGAAPGAASATSSGSAGTRGSSSGGGCSVGGEGASGGFGVAGLSLLAGTHRRRRRIAPRQAGQSCVAATP